MTEDRKVLIKSKIAAKDTGNPKLVTSLPDGQNSLVLGRILGIANKVKRGVDPRTDKPYEGLAGSFEARPANEEKEIIRSGTLYLPESLMNMLIEALEQTDEETGKKINQNIQIAFEVTAVKADNPQGYTWAFTPLLKVEQADPLAAIRSNIGDEPKALPAPSADEIKEGKRKKD